MKKKVIFFPTALCPGQFSVDETPDGSAQVEDRVGHDDVVVDGDDQGEDDHGHSDTLKKKIRNSFKKTVALKKGTHRNRDTT